MLHVIYNENMSLFKFGRHIGRVLKKNDFGRYFPIFIEIRGIVSYTTNERAMTWFH